MQMEEAALKYLSTGLSVIPVGMDKKPLIPWKEFQDRRATPQEIVDWWTKFPDANIGVVTGAISGIVVVDIDSADGLQRLKHAIPSQQLSTTTCRTGRGGLHLYYKHPGKPVKNMVGWCKGVDIRGDGGYVVVPPSVHVSGHVYEWVKHVPMKLTPNAVLQASEFPEYKPPLGPEDWETAVEKGNRNQELARRAGKLIRSGMEVDEVIETLSVWNKRFCRPPLPNGDVKTICESVKRTDESNKRHTEIKVADSDISKTGFRVMPFRQALDTYGMEEVTWIIKDWLPESTIGMAIAAPGTYKTWLLLELAFSIASGKNFLGQYPVLHKGPVIVIQQEDPFPLLFARLASIMGIGPVKDDGDTIIVPAPPEMPEIYWHPDRKLNFDKPETLVELEKAIRTIKPILVLIDPLYSASSTEDYMAKSAQSMLVLKTFRDRYGCSFFIAHHTTKGSSSAGSVERTQLWGSQFLNAWLETGWQIRATGIDNKISVKRHYKGAAPLDNLLITFDISDNHFLAEVEEDTHEDQLEKAKVAVATGEVKSVEDLAYKMGMKGKGQAAKILQEINATKSIKDGGYELPDDFSV